MPLPYEPRQREIRVFVSSTFRDMHEEREELVKQIFPQLRRLCVGRRYGTDFYTPPQQLWMPSRRTFIKQF
jgi:hypothetical protein